MQSKPNPRSRRRATTQTIDQIEARAAAIREAEFAALTELARGLRELAVALPEGSHLALTFAQRAKSIDTAVDYRWDPEVHGSIEMVFLDRDLERHWQMGGEGNS